MVRPRCIVSYCENLGRHKFPKDEERRKQWIQAIEYLKPKMTINTYSGICSDHFRISDFSVIPAYWNNYYSAKILKKSAVPSVFKWNETPVEDQAFEEQPTSSSSTQDTVSFNPERVKATYSRGQIVKQLKPNTVHKPQPYTNKYIQKSGSTFTIQNAKNTSYSNRLMQQTTHAEYVNIENHKRFLPPGVINNDKKRLKISSVPPKNSKIVGKVRIVVPKTGLPQNYGKIQGEASLISCLPPNVIIKTEHDVETCSTDDMLPNNGEFMQDESIFTSCLPLEVNIKTEEDLDTVSTDNILPDKSKIQDERKLTSCLPPEVSIKTEKEDEPCTMIKVEVDMLQPIKREINLN